MFQNIKTSIIPKKRLAIFLYRLSRGDYCHTIVKMSSHGLSIIQNIINEVFSVIVSNLCYKFVIFPGRKNQKLRAIFKIQSMLQFPCVFGRIDGCHIPTNIHMMETKHVKSYYICRNFVLLLWLEYCRL